jgi:hypothetical protein
MRKRVTVKRKKEQHEPEEQKRGKRKKQYRDWYRIGKVERKRRNNWKGR